MLERLKNFDLDRMDVDELVFLSALARTLKQEYEAVGAETPEWVDTRARELRREIRARHADLIEKRLREAKMRLEALKPASERRKDVEAEIARLEAMVASQ